MNENLAQQLQLLPDYLGRHLQLTVLALGIGIAISVPLAVAIRRTRLEGPLLAIVGVIQTIPGLALLALMVPLLGMIGFVPALIALTLYSMLPIVQNTVTGLNAVDPDALEAGRGIGMTRRQLLTTVELPLAAPVIIAGIRTAAVWVVGIATLSTPVGATSLGNYIFSGLQTRNYTAVLVGCFAAAGLALALDLLIRLIESAARRRSLAVAGAALAVLLAGIALGLAPLYRSTATAPAAGGSEYAQPKRRVVIGAKTFTEQYILAELLRAELAAAGYDAEVLSSLGSTVIFDALTGGQLDVYVDYSGTIWANYLKREDSVGATRMQYEISKTLSEQHGLAVIPLGFENAYCIAMRSDQATELGIATIADLKGKSETLRMGSDYEFFQRPEWKAVKETYGIGFGKEIVLDPSLMYEALREGKVEAISAYTTDGRISAYELKVLGDPRSALPPYDALLLLSAAAATNSELKRALTLLGGRISDEEMREANKLVDVDGKSVSEAAVWLAEQLD
jgi:osmoprotectant transport system permease protein